MLAPVPETVDSVIREYARRYSEHDVDGVTDLCISPFLAIRDGQVECLRQERSGPTRHKDDLPHARRGRQLALPLLYESLLKPSARATKCAEKMESLARSGHACFHEAPLSRTSN